MDSNDLTPGREVFVVLSGYEGLTIGHRIIRPPSPHQPAGTVRAERKDGGSGAFLRATQCYPTFQAAIEALTKHAKQMGWTNG